MKAEDSDSTPVEDIVAAFLLEREEGREPNVDDWLARHPKHAEVLAKLLSDDTASPATLRRPTGRGATGRGPDMVRLGPYEVIQHVSTAGGGTVYRARHAAAGHVVALKVLDTRGAVDPRDLERFRREAAMLRALDLVHVVPVLETGEEGGRFWIAMKWLEGETFSKLREAAADRSHRLFDLRERARLVARIARTFAAIHGYGVLHRDVKPTNIMVDKTGEPMIIDFGIAHAPDLPELTATTDQVMGTPRFLAPELLAGGNRQVSPQTDVYGLGLCLYELCTGAEAFKHEQSTDLFTAIRTTGPLHPRKANPALSHDLAAVILRAIEIPLARRYPDMTAFADDLDRVARGEAPDPATLRGAHPLLRAVRRHRRRLIAAACLAAVIVPAAWMWASRAMDVAAAGKAEAVLRPCSWFSPDAFASGLGVPGKDLAARLAQNPAATSEQALLAAWIPFLCGDVEQAYANLGVSDLPDDGFAARVLRDHLRDLEANAGQGHRRGTFVDQTTSRPAVNPKTEAPYEVEFPIDDGDRSYTRDPAKLDAFVQAVSLRWPPSAPLDHLVLATLMWSLVPNDPRIDTSARRAAIEREVEHAVGSEATRPAALHLRGVMRFVAADFAAARRDFEVVASTQPAAVGSRYLLGLAYVRTGEPGRGADLLDAVARDVPASHPARAQVLGQLAVARAAAGDLTRAREACERWLAERAGGRSWQDAVMPRVLAARFERSQGNLPAAKSLLIDAIREEEQIKLADQEEHEKGGEYPLLMPGGPEPVVLWKPAFDELLAIADALDDRDLAEEYRAMMDRVRVVPMPSSAEAYLDGNLAGLRPLDPGRALTPLRVRKAQ